VPIHPVIDQTIRRAPLEPASAAVYLLVFAAIALLAARRPAYGIAVLIVLIPFAFYRDLGATTITLSKVALLANVAGILFRRRDLLVLRHGAAALLLACGIAVAAATALSILAAAHRAPALRETLKALEYSLLFATVVVAFAADPDERPIRSALGLVLGLVSVLAIAQEWLGAPSGIWFHHQAIPRVAGPLEGPNQLAGFLGIALTLVVAYASRRGAAAYELAAIGLGSATLILTLSRTGLVATLVALGVVLATGGSGSRRPVLLALGAGCVSATALLALVGIGVTHGLGGAGLLGHFSTLAEAADPGAVGNRSELWHAAIQLWREHPFFGIGAGNFELELGSVGYPALHTHANSLYLQSLVEGGIPLALATLALVAASIARFARGPFSEPLVAGAFAASIGFGLHQIFDLLVFYPKVGELWWVALALGAQRVDAARRG